MLCGLVEDQGLAAVLPDKKDQRRVDDFVRFWGEVAGDDPKSPDCWHPVVVCARGLRRHLPNNAGKAGAAEGTEGELPPPSGNGAGGVHRSEAAEFGGAIQAAREHRARMRSAGEAGADAADGEEGAGDSGFGAQPERRRIRWLDNEGGDLASVREFSRFHTATGVELPPDEADKGAEAAAAKRLANTEAVVTQATGPGSWSSVLKSVRDMGLGNGAGGPHRGDGVAAGSDDAREVLSAARAGRRAPATWRQLGGNGTATARGSGPHLGGHAPLGGRAARGV